MRSSVTLKDRWCFETNQSQTSFYQNNFSLCEPTGAIKILSDKKRYGQRKTIFEGSILHLSLYSVGGSRTKVLNSSQMVEYIELSNECVIKFS